MACYKPLEAFQSLGNTGKSVITFTWNKQKGDYRKINLPCGQCIGCRLERSRQWALRCMHEAQLHDQNNMFLTLTYNDQNLPNDKSLNLRHFQLFMKRYRKYVTTHDAYGVPLGKIKNPDTGRWKQVTRKVTIRFYHCGEYGEKHSRPHYHACIFGHKIHDLRHWKTKRGNNLYLSPTLEKLWGLGYVVIGNVTFESAAYVARYITKKINGPKQQEHYSYVDPQTGEISSLRPEYNTMSRREGIGKNFIKKYLSDFYPADRVIFNGKEMRPPKYYDNFFEIHSPEEMAKIKEERIQRKLREKLDKENRGRLKRARLDAELAVRQAGINLFKQNERNYENGSESNSYV